MKVSGLLLFVLLVLKGGSIFAQGIDGVWRGYFFSGGDSVKIVIELQTRGNIITGKSYTRHYEPGGHLDITCSIEGRISGDSITFREKKVIEMKPYFKNTNCLQQFSLTLLVAPDRKRIMTGNWKGTAAYCGKGKAYFTERKGRESNYP
jgi:hypothetical protein